MKYNERNPLVSVIIPVYNREKTIKRAIESVLNQTYKNIEIVVIDDCSTDNTSEILHQYINDIRVKIYYQEENVGANRARNRGIGVAQGEYIAFQDSDDEWLPWKLEKQIAYMQEKGYLVSYSSYQLFEDGEVRIVPSDVQVEELSGEKLKEKLKRRNTIGTPTLIVHRRVFEKIGRFDENMPRLQDYELMIRIVNCFEVGYINEPLVKAYRMKECISNNSDKWLEAILLLIEKHADFLDIKTWWNFYLRDSRVVSGGVIDWILLNRAIDRVTRGEDVFVRERYLKLTTEFAAMQYNKLREIVEDDYIYFISKLVNEEFAIYGAGFFGKKVYEELKHKELMPKCFLVTEKKENDFIDKIPIYGIAEWEDKRIPVIIATNRDKQIQIREQLVAKEMFRYISYPKLN